MSSKPVLYYSPRSAPCRAVLLIAAALELDLDFRLVNMSKAEHLTVDFLKLNPLHTVPVLDDNGNLVTDSHVICAYLADKYDSKGTLYPKDPKQRRLVDALLYYDCGHLFPRVRFIIEPIIYYGANEIPRNHVSYLQRAYDGIENCLTPGPYLTGKHLTIADFCAISSVSTAAAFAGICVEDYPKTAAWVTRMQELPYYREQNQIGLDLLVKIVRTKLTEREAI